MVFVLTAVDIVVNGAQNISLLLAIGVLYNPEPLAMEIDAEKCTYPLLLTSDATPLPVYNVGANAATNFPS
jgi:hypothetical protein